MKKIIACVILMQGAMSMADTDHYARVADVLQQKNPEREAEAKQYMEQVKNGFKNLVSNATEDVRAQLQAEDAKKLSGILENAEELFDLCARAVDTNDPFTERKIQEAIAVKTRLLFYQMMPYIDSMVARADKKSPQSAKQDMLNAIDFFVQLLKEQRAILERD